MTFLDGYGPQMLAGALATLEIAFASLAAGLFLGLVGAAAKLSSWKPLSLGATLLTNLLRGTPEFIILLVCYFGLAQQLYRMLGRATEMSPFFGGVFALSVVFGSNASESFRGAFVAVPAGQTEAARAIGMSASRVFFRIQLPQAWRLVLPSLSNLWQNLLKDTSLVSVLGLDELMHKASIAAQVTHQPLTFYLAAAAIYFVLLAASGPVFGLLDARASRGVRRA